MDTQSVVYIIWAAAAACLVLIFHTALGPVVSSRKRRLTSTVGLLVGICAFAWYAVNGFRWQPLPWTLSGLIR